MQPARIPNKLDGQTAVPPSANAARLGNSGCQLLWKEALRKIFRAYPEHGICLVH
jgi:hypothetical protein